MSEQTIVLSYPNQLTYKCPLCELCYSVYSSFTRHVSEKHPDERITYQFNCDVCGRDFQSKRAVANHHSKTHGKADPVLRSSQEAGAYRCDFCDDGFPSKKAVAQHIRNQHPAEASEQRATQAAIWESRYWSSKEKQLFMEALNKFGTLSNTAIAKHIGTKTAKQVGVHKRIFLRENPEWSAPQPQNPSLSMDNVNSSPSGIDSDNSGPADTPATVRNVDNQSGSPTMVSVPENPTPSKDNSFAAASDLTNVAPSELIDDSDTSLDDISSLLDKTQIASTQEKDFHRRIDEAITMLRNPSPATPETRPGASDNPAPSKDDSFATASNHTSVAPSELVNDSDTSLDDISSLLDKTQITSTQERDFHRRMDEAITMLRNPSPASPETHPSTSNSSTRPMATNATPVDNSIPSTSQTNIPVITPSSRPHNTSTGSNSKPRRKDLEDRDKRMKSFMEEIHPFVNKVLSEEEWRKLESMTDRLVTDLKGLITREPRRHPTSNWKKRQRRRRQQESRTTQQSQSQTPESPLSSQSQSQRRESHQDNPSSQCPSALHPSQQPHRRNARRARAQEAGKLQRWYRNNKKRCVRHIMGDNNSPLCEIPLTQLESHFSDDPQSGSADKPPPPDFLPQCERSSEQDELTLTVTPEEVKFQLKRLPSQSSPGPDGVPYFVWRSSDYAPQLLSTVYSICCLNQRVPQSWKESNTILIFKRDDPMVPRNWRPISLQPTIYKVYAAILARRLASWALANQKISPSQKGFLPFEGCVEHSFLLRSVLEDSKRRRKDVRIVWLDLKNAFGSVPHSIMWDMMDRLDVPTDFSTLCKEIYQNSSQRVRSKDGYTNPIPVTRGIKQGCPLSPLLFNIVLEGILPHLECSGDGYKFQGGSMVKALAYADDLCVIGSGKESVNHVLEQLHKFLQWSGLAVNPSKCGALSIINRGSRKYVEPFQPMVGSELLPALKWEDHYKYLGIRTGRQRLGSPDGLEEEMVRGAEAICSSLLTDWQKLEACNMFILSKANYFLDAALLDRTWVTGVDAKIRKLVKKAMKLPKRSLGAFFYATKAHGGLGLRSLEDSLDVSSITHAVRSLTSRDQTLQNIAWAQLTSVVKKRTGKEQLCDADLQDFLNNAPPTGEARRGDVKSSWSSVRKSLKLLGCEVEISGTEVHLTYGDASVETNQKSRVTKLLHLARSSMRLEQLLSAPDQGRAFHHLSKHPSSNHWIQSGAYTSFAEYRFATRARLNLLPTRTVMSRAGRPDLDTTCPKCKQEPQTLGHVLNACTPNTGLMRERHNTILKRLVSAVPDHLGDKFVEQKIRDSPGCDKPDLVILNKEKKHAVIVDVTIPFEGSEEAFTVARNEKIRRYSPLKEWLVSQDYTDVFLDAFIVGALGSWDIANQNVLKSLGIGQSYSTLFRKLCVTDAIKGSLAIWKCKD